MRVHQNVRVSHSQAPALSGTDSQNGALRVGSGNLQPTGPPIVTRPKSYHSVERKNHTQSRNKKANAASLGRKRRTNRPTPDRILTKAELQSDRYIAYRKKQKDKARGVWSDELEAIFQQGMFRFKLTYDCFRWSILKPALREIPNLGKKKTDCDPQQCGSFTVSRASGRNEHITHFIQNCTGEYRCRKQVSSHIQVLKHFQKDNEECMWCLVSAKIDSHRNHADHLSSGLRLVTKPEPDTKMPESYTINVHHRYPVHEMPSHASDSFNEPATPMNANSSLGKEMLTAPLTNYRFTSSMPHSNLPIIETCTSQKFYFHPNQPSPPPPTYYPSSQDVGQLDLQFVARDFYTHQQSSEQVIPRQIPSSQLDPIQTGDIRDQEFNNSMPNPFSFFDDRRDPRDGPLTSSATPVPLVCMLDRPVDNLSIHQHSPPAPQHPQLASTQSSNPQSDPFDDIENHWVHHNTPVGSISVDGSCDPFDDMDAWPVPMDQNDIDTWTIELNCNNPNNCPPHQPGQNDNDEHLQQQHDSTPSATTSSYHDGSFSDQHQPAEEPNHGTDLLTQTDYHIQLSTVVDMDGAEDAEGDLDVDLAETGPHAPQQEEDSQMQEIKLEHGVWSMIWFPMRNRRRRICKISILSLQG